MRHTTSDNIDYLEVFGILQCRRLSVYLTIGLLTGFIVGGCIGVLAWAFLQNLFAISICAGIGMLIGIVIGTLIDYEKNNHQEK